MTPPGRTGVGGRGVGDRQLHVTHGRITAVNNSERQALERSALTSHARSQVQVALAHLLTVG